MPAPRKEYCHRGHLLEGNRYIARDGRSGGCSMCKPLVYRENRERIKWRGRERRYGITHEQFDVLADVLCHECPICQKPCDDNGYAVDHDHRTGAVRGLLCRPCNLALGGFGDDITTLSRAIAYLDRSFAAEYGFGDDDSE